MDHSKKETMTILGPGMWFIIHESAIECDKSKDLSKFKSAVACVANAIPCLTCKGELFMFQMNNSIDEYSRKGPDGLFKWTVALHNTINSNLKTKAFTLEGAKSAHQETKNCKNCTR